jgi:acyl-CoA synthetase (AMP-forming)/AMP-acid ligase II
MNVADALARWARETPFAVAIVEPRRILHYRALDAAVWRAAARLAADGFRAGDRVGLSLASNSALYLVQVYALARLGAVALLLPVDEPPDFRLGVARRFGLTAVIGADETARLGDLPLLRPDESCLAPGPVHAGPSAAGGAAPLKICLSSGTTGTPKGMIRTHGDHLRLCAIGRNDTGLAGRHDRFLALLAFHFGFGLEEAMITLDGGGMVRIMPLPVTVAELSAVIDREDITRLAVIPVLIEALLGRLAGDRPRFPGIRNLTLSSSLIPEGLRREIRRRLTPNLTISYGANESSYIASADLATLARFPDTVGFPVPGAVIEIVDEQGAALPPGQVGLVRLRSTALVAGYLDDPEATARAFRDGWHYPGDLGMLSPEGALFLKGRVDDQINHDGVKLYPNDIEEVLLGHAAVVEAAAFPLIMDGYREIPAAAVVLRQAVTSDALVDYCRERLGPRAPRRLFVRDELPKSLAGKVLKRELAAQLAR